MLFWETLLRLKPEIDKTLDELFDVVKSNQQNEQDLLLIIINGFYEKSLEKNGKLSPFVFGTGGWSYYADSDQYFFYDSYRGTINETPRDKYFKDYDENDKKQAEYRFLLHIELMVYLKFWESEQTLKRLYQLSRLAQNKSYDWQFLLTKDDSRHELIREKIRDGIKNVCPKYYKLLKDIYLSQIRNAAAHSQFYILYQSLGFTNYNPKNAPLTQEKFIDWEDRFHKLILLQDGILKRLNVNHKEYVDKQVDKEFGLEIRATFKGHTRKNTFLKYVTTGSRPDWMWYDNWKKNHKYK